MLMCVSERGEAAIKTRYSERVLFISAQSTIIPLGYLSRQAKAEKRLGRPETSFVRPIVLHQFHFIYSLMMRECVRLDMIVMRLPGLLKPVIDLDWRA